MIWPVAALAFVLLAFVVVYGSRLQARVESEAPTVPREDAEVDFDVG
jgi:hypothetical protein